MFRKVTAFGTPNQARAGFEVVALYRGFDRRPFDGTGEIFTLARAL